MAGNDTQNNCGPKTNCTLPYGGIDDARFGEPMLWLGLYVSLASAVCAAAMGADIVRSLGRSKLWVSPKFFVLNAAVLTILGVATKIPNDINGTMPGLLDQNAKLSGILLICLAMTHAMPSLGMMGNRELLSNMVALGILVVSTAVNICFQINTQVITRYALLNGICTITMVLMFSILVSHSLNVASIKQHLEKLYQSRHREILSEVGQRVLSGEELERYVKKYWLMALSSSPDFVLSTSGMSPAFIILYMMLIGAFAASLVSSLRKREKGCYVESDYKWTTGVVLLVQLLTVAMGCASVWGRLSWYNGQYESFRKLLYVEKYRFQQLGRWKKHTLPFLAGKERVRSAAYHAKNLGVNLLILFQWIMTFLTRLLSVVFFYLGLILPFLVCLLCFVLDKGSEPAGSSGGEESLSGYVFLLEGDTEEDWKEKIATKWEDHPDNWLDIGRARSPRRLLDLLTVSSSCSPSFDEGSSSCRMPRTTSIRRSRSVITSELLEDCWSLHLATLMCVIHAAFYGTCGGEDGADNLGYSLVRALDEGFLYFTLVDANNIGRTCSKKALQAAEMVRDDLLFRGEWLDRPLRDKQTASLFCDTIQDLKARADRYARDEHEGLPKQVALEALAADSMFRITGALQLDGDRPWSLEEMEAEAAALVESCLKDLPAAIFGECSRGSCGYREDHVRLAAQVLGETESILKILNPRRLSSSSDSSNV